MALLIEAVHHWGALNVVALTKAKKLPPPMRLFGHDDRPGGPEQSSTRRVLTIAQFAEEVKGGDGDGG